MSGKRAKPTPWRFVRVAPLVILTVVAVWVMVGFYLLLPGSGSDQAHDWGIEPVPSSSEDAVPVAPDSSSVRSPEPSTPGAATAWESATAPNGSSLGQRTAAGLELSGASASTPNARPSPRPSDPTDAAPTEREPGPPEDNPGKKKGHRDGHGPNDDRP